VIRIPNSSLAENSYEELKIAVDLFKHAPERKDGRAIRVSITSILMISIVHCLFMTHITYLSTNTEYARQVVTSSDQSVPRSPRRPWLIQYQQ
jgi:hypothetical protein